LPDAVGDDFSVERDLGRRLERSDDASGKTMIVVEMRDASCEEKPTGGLVSHFASLISGKER
jgi:hypothetical protein